MRIAAGRYAVAVVACLLLLARVHAQQAPASGDPEYLLMDVSTGRVLASRWDDPGRPVPAGSLIKPFTALAYAAAHAFTYPTVTCQGSAGRCWLPEGHGRIGLRDAIAGSCNDYFHHLAKSIVPDAFAATLGWFGLRVDTSVVTEDTMVGLGDELMLPPVALARAYAELVARAGQPGVTPILEGMRMSASTGTGRGVGAASHLAGAFVKTGTSPCAHTPRATADGHTVVVYPADRPRVVLLVQAHGRTGADTAVLAGKILASAPEAR